MRTSRTPIVEFLQSPHSRQGATLKTSTSAAQTLPCSHLHVQQRHSQPQPGSYMPASPQAINTTTAPLQHERGSNENARPRRVGLALVTAPSFSTPRRGRGAYHTCSPILVGRGGGLGGLHFFCLFEAGFRRTSWARSAATARRNLPFGRAIAHHPLETR